MPIRGTPRYGDAIITVLVTPTENEIQALKANSIINSLSEENKKIKSEL
jgi:hypothetical protein